MEAELDENSYDDYRMFNTLPEETMQFDYTESDLAEEIDKGIRDTIIGIRLSILAMGVGLAKIKMKGMYTDLNCRSMAEYIEGLCDDTKMDRSSIFNWLYIGEAYIKYQNDLEQIGFTDSDGPTKLPYLERALASNEEQTVFNNIKNMSVREFVTFAKGQAMIDCPTDNNNRRVVTVRGNNIYVNGKLAIIVSKKIDQKASAYFMKLIRIACEALKKEEVILPVRLRNMREARRFERAVKLLKAKMGIK